jgi:hypothetical protein
MAFDLPTPFGLLANETFLLVLLNYFGLEVAPIGSQFSKQIKFSIPILTGAALPQ